MRPHALAGNGDRADRPVCCAIKPTVITGVYTGTEIRCCLETGTDEHVNIAVIIQPSARKSSHEVAPTVIATF